MRRKFARRASAHHEDFLPQAPLHIQLNFSPAFGPLVYRAEGASFPPCMMHAGDRAICDLCATVFFPAVAFFPALHSQGVSLCEMLHQYSLPELLPGRSTTYCSDRFVLHRTPVCVSEPVVSTKR